MGFSLVSTFSEPFYLGGGTSTEVAASVAEVALGGLPLLIDMKADIKIKHTTVEILRQQADQSEAPGEQSVNPEGFWRRVRESWHYGAGQEYADRKDSSEHRFRRSRGVDVWEKWQLSLLNDVGLKQLAASANQYLAVAGSHLYHTDGTVLRYWTDIIGPGTSTTVTGTPVTAPTAMVSDGFNVWTVHGTALYKTTRGAGATASHITGLTAGVQSLGYVRNRVMYGQGRSLYDITALAVGGGGALPAALFTHGNTDWNWVDFAEGTGFIFAAGASGDKSLIYKTAVKQDGTALDIPSVAAELPDGEVITHINGYLGRFLFVGTQKGWRFGVVAGNGDVSLGALVENDAPVLCSEGQGQFFWYGQGVTDSTFTGLGRLSTAFFTDLDNLVPAYASDLMVSGQTNNIQDVVTFQGVRVFTIQERGMFFEEDFSVATGYLDTGDINFNMVEKKVGLWVDVGHLLDPGSFEVQLAFDGGSFVSIGDRVVGQGDPTPFGVGEITAQTFELRLILNRDTVDATLRPKILNWLLRVQPRPQPTKLVLATVIVSPEMLSNLDTPLDYNTFDVQAYIEDLHANKTVTTWQEFPGALWSVMVDNYETDLVQWVRDGNGPDGQINTIFLKLKVVN